MLRPYLFLLFSIFLVVPIINDDSCYRHRVIESANYYNRQPQYG